MCTSTMSKGGSTLLFSFFFGFCPDSDILVIMKARIVALGSENKLAATSLALYGACSVDNIYRGYVWTGLWTGQFDLNTLHVDVKIF